MDATIIRKGALALIFSILVTTSFTYAQSRRDAVEVTKLRFDDTDLDGKSAEKWMRVEIELTARGQITETPRNEDWVDDIEVTFSAVFKTEDGPIPYVAYESSMTILTLEIGEDRPIFFYLPWDIVERDNFAREPFGWEVKLSVGGQEIPLSKQNTRNRISKTISSTELLESYRNLVAENAPRSEGSLRPQYLVEWEDVREESPTLRRYDVTRD